MLHSPISKLSLRSRFAALGAIVFALIAFPVTAWLSGQYVQWRTVNAERDGLKSALKLISVADALAEHRHFSLRQLSADQAAGAKRAEVQRRAQALMHEAEQALSQYSAATRAPLEKAAGDFSKLASAVAKEDLQARAAFDQHGPILDGVEEALARIVAESGLVLDGHLGNYFLIIAGMQESPALVSLLGQLRSLGSSALANKGASQLDLNQIAALQARITDRTRVFRFNLEASAQLGSHVQVPQGMAAALTATLALNEQVFLGLSTDWSVPKDEYYDKLSAAIDAQRQLSTTISDVVGQQLDERLAAVEQRVLVTFLLGGTLLLGSVLLLVSSVRRITVDAQRVLQRTETLATGRLDMAPVHEVARDSRNELDRVQLALEDLRLAWTSSIIEIRAAVDMLGAASSEIASGNQDLSARTEHSAVNIQQTASSVEQLSANMRLSADSAQKANELASAAHVAAEQGGHVVSQVVQTMNEIHANSQRIADIVSMIESIAFQTNILALNAAVEAARAGEQGRGFAVVAAEVRGLAHRSSQSAREIKSLIEVSMSSVESGAGLVSEAGVKMSNIVDSVGRVAAMINCITHTSLAQSQSVAQVNNAVGELDEMTQQNAALVEQSAAAADSLRTQASRLARSVATFRVAAAGLEH